MGVVKSNFVKLKILWIFFYISSVNCTDVFTDAGTTGVTLNPGLDSDTFIVDEQLGPCTLAFINYNGETSPEINGGQSKLFINDFDAKIVKVEEKWAITIEKSPDFETLTLDNSYALNLKLENDDDNSFFVTVTNSDDNPPFLDVNSRTCLVEEGPSGLGDRLECTYTVRDQDGCAGAATLSIEDENQNEIFSFEYDNNKEDPTKCLGASISDLKRTAQVHLKVNSELDYEKITNYYMNMIVKDLAGASGSAQIVVTVKDLPDSKPVWTTSVFSFSVNELETKSFSVVAIDGDRDIDADICYSLTVEGDIKPEEKDYFEIDKTTGVVTVHEIDRDEYQHNTYSLSIVAFECEDTESKIETTVSVLVVDVNNKIPEICIRKAGDDTGDCQTDIEIPIEEGKPSSFSSFIKISMFDWDEGDAGTYMVSLEDFSEFKWSDAFSVIPDQGYHEAQFTISVSDSEKLDYEDENWRNIEINLVATEVKDPNHNMSIPISIILMNVNDNQPVFQHTEDDGTLTATVTENQLANFKFITVLATDADGPEDIVSYGLVQAKGLTIDPKTGDISTATDNVFDYELQQQMIVQVFAQDSMVKGTPKVFTTLAITIEDEDDVPPQISLDATTADVSELEEPGNSVPVSVIGTDVDTNSLLKFRIDWDTTSGRKDFKDVDKEVFRDCYNIDGVYDGEKNFIGTLTVAKKLSWNVVDTLKLVIVVEDLNTVKNFPTANTTLTVNIRDENDHKPVFDSCEELLLNVDENTVESVKIVNGQIKAHDDDSSENRNNLIKYSIKPNAENCNAENCDDDDYAKYIVIDPDNGYLYTGSGVINREKYGFLKYTVVALNEGGPDGGESTCQLSITVNDLNDNVPQQVNIEKEPVSIPEDVESGVHITFLTYSDADVTASFKTIKFEIDDRNLMNYFEIYDDGAGKAELIVNLTNGAKFDYDDGNLRNYDVKIKIYDNPLREDGGLQQFVDPPPTIHVNLLDVNDNDPIFDDKGSSNNNPENPCFFEVTEDKKEKEILTEKDKIHAGDKDSDDFGKVNYNLISVTCVEGTNNGCIPPEDALELFDLSPDQNAVGQINIIAKTKLLSVFGEYMIEINANDNGDPPRKSVSRFYKGCITDVNDHDPQIVYPDGSYLKIIKAENGEIVQDNQSPIPLFKATDEDFGDNAVVTFYIEWPESGGQTIPFQLSTRNQPLNTAKFELRDGTTFDDLSQLSYSLIIKACNGQNTADCRSQQKLTVYKVQTEEVEPAWEDGDRVKEQKFTEGPIDDPKNTLTLPEATDKNDIPGVPGEEPPPKQPIYYYIIGANDDNYTSFFEINTTKGVISLIDNLHYQYRNYWEFTIQASNYDDIENIPKNPNEKSKYTVKITVDDINDNPPYFEQEKYSTSVDSALSNSPQQFLIVKATDLDVVDQGQIVYSKVDDSFENHIESGSQIGFSAIDLVGATGALTFKADIDSSVKGYMLFKIRATDSAPESHTDECLVQLYIISENNKVQFKFRNLQQQVFASRYIAADVFNRYFEQYGCVPGQISSAEDVHGVLTTLWVHFMDESGNPIEKSVIDPYLNNARLLLDLKNELAANYSLLLDAAGGNSDDNGKPEEDYVLRNVLIAVCAVLGFLLISLLALFIVKTKNLRQLVGGLTKATAPVEDKGNFALPNTNQYINEGSNPVYNVEINTQQMDNASISSDDSSLIGIEDNPEFQAFYNSVVLKNEDNDILKENPQLNAFSSSNTGDFNF